MSIPSLTQNLTTIADALSLRAAGFIVTLYGDAVVPRGGEVWIGTIIETCASVGISETLVRTAVSRLVAAGQLEGWRRGRRSFYRLTERAEAEFADASRLIYGPPEVWQWRFVHLPEAGAEVRMASLERLGYARLRPTLAVGPARVPAPRGCLVFDAVPDGPDLPAFAAETWDLAPHAAAYRTILDLFAPLERYRCDSGAEALAARLLLVHAWRHALLRDPRLPPEALPLDWPGHAARSLFHRLYAVLSPAADSHVGTRFEGPQGRLALIPARHAEARETEANQGIDAEVRRLA
ncbi:MAG: PaaX family transcriptional regulator [Rhodobacteraceae bacterium]|nr:PaaX family transcriptional regulator [Paracoccaceae bacterium]